MNASRELESQEKKTARLQVVNWKAKRKQRQGEARIAKGQLQVVNWKAKRKQRQGEAWIAKRQLQVEVSRLYGKTTPKSKFDCCSTCKRS
jgi:hypothetical protein